VTERNLAFCHRGEIDAVIAGAVTNDGGEFWHQIHHAGTERRSARRDHRANVGELFGRVHLIRRLARGIQEFVALADPQHQGLWETRIDQDFFGHVVVLSLSQKQRRNRSPDSALISSVIARP
jgi:hypothetical protein